MEPAILQKDGSITLPANGSSSTASPATTSIKTQHQASENGSSNVYGLRGRDVDGNGTSSSSGTGTFSVKCGLASMLKGGVIMDVMSVEQAKIAEEAGACAVMVLER